MSAGRVCYGTVSAGMGYCEDVTLLQSLETLVVVVGECRRCL